MENYNTNKSFVIDNAADVGIGTVAPDESAALDIVASDKVALLPRMTTAERDTINGGNPAIGLIIYNISTNEFNFFNGSVWVPLAGGGESAQYTRTEVLSPAYAGAIFEPDGSNNLGSMYEKKDTVGNIWWWETKQATMQDYDIVVRYTIPEKFVNFLSSNQISLVYQTDGTNLESLLDVTLQKEGDPVIDEFTGSGLSLSSNTWLEDYFSLNDIDKWVAGDVILLRIKMMATVNNDVRIGDIKIRYVSQ